ncbi:hypothetical protein PQQ96_21605 [Paraburkholderia sediminicola]|uniref:hypothetical protein n=1 Tax=Paraburkholderia sediminicola TaxID=458836 RepID=UPI0038B79096
MHDQECHEIQGNLIARPMSADEVAALSVSMPFAYRNRRRRPNFVTPGVERQAAREGAGEWIQR